MNQSIIYFENVFQIQEFTSEPMIVIDFHR